MASKREQTDVRNLGRELSAVVAVAADLERVGSLEQATRDAEETYRKTKEKVAEVSGLLVTEEEKLSETQMELYTARENLAGARINANSLIAAARREAGDIVDLANEEANQTRSNTREDMKRRQTTHDSHMKIYKSLEEEAQGHLATIEAELKTLREKFG